jgi:antitoxin YefM
MYMNTIPLATARAQLSRVIDDAVATHDRISITRNGVPAAVLLSVDDFESIMETLEILSDAEEVRAIAAAQQELRDRESYSRAEVEEAMRAVGRL